ncbi:MAG: hypothetical protein JO165_04985 [Candidatus Eremiobacteraeota bacterium]|nr:hypothetical protein [Candidatus Eremiobacteraeota bacterium]
MRRILRNPGKYFRRSFWLTIKQVLHRRFRPHVLFGPAQLLRRVRGERPLQICVIPSRMNKYQYEEVYVAWKVFRFCNLNAVSSPDAADLAIHWEPATQFSADGTTVEALQARMPVINAACTDIRKSLVDRVFEEVFGYSVAVDPRTFHGVLLRKSENNGTHDAVLLDGPLEPEEGYVYQRLVTPTALQEGLADFRTFIVGAEVVAVNRNFRSANDRFRTVPVTGDVIPLDEAFTQAELDAIREFNQRMGLDFGALDIIRDGDDGRIYILDCNNTPTGPSAKLSIPRQLAIIKKVGAAFEKTYLSGLRAKRSSRVGAQPTPAEQTLTPQ